MEETMEILNLSAEPEGKLRQWLPHDLVTEKVVFLPDACPGKSPLPTGTAVLTRQADWRRFAISDCGCGMRLVRSELSPDDLSIDAWNNIADRLRKNKGSLGDLGGGNHFLDALAPYKGNHLYLLIHTGSRLESGLVDAYVDQPAAFDQEFSRVVSWAEKNRACIHAAAEVELGPLELILDLPHNTFEPLTQGGAIIRKGSVHVKPGDLNIIPSHMAGDVALVRATEQVTDSLESLSHGTGRAMSRSDCKPLAAKYDFHALRNQLMIPEGIEDTSLRTDGPFAYRDLDACLGLLAGYVTLVERFAVVGYMGHL
jgi:RNA-splicing ligase RtcB